MAKNIIIAVVRFYQKFLSPLKLPSCRFTPTCSSYAIQALEFHGFFKGLGLSALRVLKCHPFHPGGYHPVQKNSDK